MTNNTDTIIALATPPGRSGVAVIRISGAKAAMALERLGASLPAPRMASLTQLRSAEGDIIDRALVISFPAPHSFTGEDVIELHLHGSRAVIQETLAQLAVLPGIRLAEAGEFTKRAFLNGKMDLTAAEGLADLIDADTTAQRRQALRQMEGKLGEFMEALRASLVSTLAHLEAYIDFPDEEIPESVMEGMQSAINSIRATIAAQLNDGHKGEKIREGLYAAIIGPPNAGKSSLLNRLAGRDVAIVSARAGTTRDVIEVQMDINGLPLTLADTAGIREQEDDIEAEGIRRTLDRAARADIKLALFDINSLHAPDPATLALVDAQTIIVLSKADTITAPSPLPTIAGQQPLLVSAVEDTGMDQVMAAIGDRLEQFNQPDNTPLITRLRHREALTEAAACLERFHTAPALELQCEELRLAARAIGKITGRIDVDELLDRIFSDFCIGK